MEQNKNSNVWTVRTRFTQNRISVDRWKIFLDNGVFALGWKELGDVSQLTSTWYIDKKYKECYDDNFMNMTNASWSLYSFYQKGIQIGDFLIAIESISPWTIDHKHRVFGIGRVTGQPFYDDKIGVFGSNEEILPNIILVDWQECDFISEKLVHNNGSLTNFWNIGNYPEIITLLKNKFSSFENEVFFEGSVRELTLTIHERNREARDKCLEIHGVNCSVCDFNFEGFYGDVGKGFIHVHHLENLSMSNKISIDPRKDLRPVCPNCHAMLHQQKPAYTIEELKQKIKESHK